MIELNDVLAELDRIADEYGVEDVQYEADIHEDSVKVTIYTYVEQPFLVFFTKKIRRIISVFEASELNLVLPMFEQMMDTLSQPPDGLQKENDEL